KHLKTLIEENSHKNKTSEKLRLKLLIENAGCAGTKYGLQLTNELKPRDRIHKRFGLEIIIPEDYIQYFENATIDLDKNKKFKIDVEEKQKPEKTI
ncbi:MAG: hypothetical protein ACFFD1_05620, partial [Candidatus Thorarchaeota archaeon]